MLKLLSKFLKKIRPTVEYMVYPTNNALINFFYHYLVSTIVCLLTFNMFGLRPQDSQQLAGIVIVLSLLPAFIFYVLEETIKQD
jgi:hypothetical protein